MKNDVKEHFTELKVKTKCLEELVLGNFQSPIFF